MSIQIEQDESEVLREFRPERRIADIVGNISDEQTAGDVDRLSDEVLLRERIEPVALLSAIRSIDDRPDMFATSRSPISDMIVMIVLSATGRLNMQIVMAGRLARIVFTYPQPCLLTNQQSPAGPEPHCLPAAAG